jgi:hypothetical protein
MVSYTLNRRHKKSNIPNNKFYAELSKPLSVCFDGHRAESYSSQNFFPAVVSVLRIIIIIIINDITIICSSG